MTQLAPLLQDLQRRYGAMDGQGFVETQIPGLHFFWATDTLARTPLIYEAGIAIIGQGHKMGYLADEVFRYDKNHYLILSIPILLECTAYANPEEPLLGIFIDIDFSTLHELISLAADHLPAGHFDIASLPRGVEPVVLEPDMMEALTRLLCCLGSSLDSEVLGRTRIREILYRALLGRHGRALYALTQHNTHYARIARAMTRIHQDFASPLSVETLAMEATMSVSAFHRAFKQATGDSPLQYLKKIRLNKAMRLLVDEGVHAGVAANRVGYESASQFSREFKRYFNVAPAQAKDRGPTPA